MIRSLALVCFLALLLPGCLKGGRAEFVSVVNDHRELTAETHEALIRSVEMEMQDLTDPDAIAALQDLIERLSTIRRQSDVIHDYVTATQVDSELVTEMIRQRWRSVP